MTRAGHTYTPQRTREYESRVRAAYYKQAGGQKITGPVQLSITAYLQIPRSANRTTQAAMMAGRIRPTKRPDLDNIVKMIDALNGIALDDDAQIVKITAEKYYSHTPRLEIVLTEL
jgi:Holliday junction resolvase RusA-like endonuclease